VQQAVRSQQLGQLAIVAIIQTGEADAGMGAICIHTSTTLNKMAVNCFTTLDSVSAKDHGLQIFFFGCCTMPQAISSA
jgi:hypothetical protein